MAGEVLDFDASGVLDRKELRRNDRTTQLALVATREAMDQAGLPERLEGELAEATGVIIGSGLGGTGTLIDQIACAPRAVPSGSAPSSSPWPSPTWRPARWPCSFGALGPELLDHQRLRLAAGTPSARPPR